MSYTPLELARRAAEHLAERGFENARLESELLLAAVLGISRLELYLQHERPLTVGEVESFRAAIRRRLRHEPIQYITGEAQFRDLTLKVDPRVLIPRPETEELVERVLEWARRRRTQGAGAAAGALTALEIGTGSGAIALSLLREGPFRGVVATDASEEALAVARENAERAGLLDRLELRAGALWRAVGASERFDIVVSNPPYIRESERAGLAPEVREWEPASALFAGPDGLEVLAPLVDGAAAHLRPEGLLAVEVGADQAAAVAERASRTGAYGRITVARDLAGRDRFVLGERSPLAKAVENRDHADQRKGRGS